MVYLDPSRGLRNSLKATCSLSMENWQTPTITVRICSEAQMLGLRPPKFQKRSSNSPNNALSKGPRISRDLSTVSVYTGSHCSHSNPHPWTPSYAAYGVDLMEAGCRNIYLRAGVQFPGPSDVLIKVTNNLSGDCHGSALSITASLGLISCQLLVAGSCDVYPNWKLC